MDFDYRRRAAHAAGARGLELYRRVLGGHAPARSHATRRLTMTERLLLELGTLLSGPPTALPGEFISRLTARFSEEEIGALTEFAGEVLAVGLLTAMAKSQSQEQLRWKARAGRPGKHFLAPDAWSLPGAAKFRE